MSKQADDLIKVIAQKHGIAVGRDDPILVMQTINEQLMADSAKAQQAMLDSYKEQLEEMALRWNNDSKLMAEKVLNSALSASKNTMLKIMEEGANATIALIQKETEAALKRVAGQQRSSRRTSIFNVIASCITLMAAIIVIWTASQ